MALGAEKLTYEDVKARTKGWVPRDFRNEAYRLGVVITQLEARAERHPDGSAAQALFLARNNQELLTKAVNEAFPSLPVDPNPAL
jgi:DNA-directed RNA polymerase specialized sigma subunit